MFAKFDPFICRHLKRIRDHKTHTHYLGHDIQNELIEIMTSEIKKNYSKNLICQILCRYYGLHARHKPPKATFFSYKNCGHEFRR